ncbi:hypothetical protein [Clostridium butyricum]|uniref:hypothetical protein n=1 Tax=Clostridium butyricum TaxID=1492 RepID=UPI002AB02DAA|nr:hypothetical protein [Clostridium butyricum]
MKKKSTLRTVSSALLISLSASLFFATDANATSVNPQNDFTDVNAFNEVFNTIPEEFNLVNINDTNNIINNMTSQQIDSRLIGGTYREATVKKTLSAPRYSQLTYDVYLTKKNAITLANKMAVSDVETIVTFFAGWLPHAMFPSLAVFIGQCNRNSAATKIRAQTDEGNNVRFRIIHNSYTNTYNYAVSYWDGSTLDYSVVTGEKIQETRLFK